MAGSLEFGVVMGRARPQVHTPGADADEDAAFQILVLGDFSGRSSAEAESWFARPAQSVDIDNFDAVLAQMTAGLRLTLPGAQGVVVEPVLRSIEDFEPDALVAQLAMFKSLRGWRTRLGDSASFAAAAAELSATGLAPAASIPAQAVAEDDADTLARLLGRPPQTAASPQPPASHARPAAVSTVLAVSAVSAVSSVSAVSAVSASLDSLLRSVLAPHIQPDMSHLQRPMVEAVDRAMGDAMRLLLRTPSWKALESAWRSVDHFVRTVDSTAVKLMLLDVRADELQADMASAAADLSASGLASAIAQRVQREGPAARPALVVALYAFGPSAAELALLGALAAVCVQHGAVLLASAAQALLAPQAESPIASDPVALANAAEDQAQWQALRATWMAGHIGLLYPRVLGRLPYGPKTNPVSAFDFDELADGFSHERLAWRSAALDAAALLAAARAEAGWRFDPNAHRMLGEYPAFIDRSGSSNRPQAGAEFYATERQSAAIAAQGLIAVLSDARSPQLRLLAWRSIAADSAPLRGRWQP